jgi:urea transporter
VLILGSLIVGAATAAFVAVLPLAVPVVVLAPIVAVLVSALVIEWDDAHQVQR